MKKYLFVFIFTALVGIQHVFAQSGLDFLLGKWNVKEYHNDRMTARSIGFIEFKQEGLFDSEGTYFGNIKGLYRTDSRSVVYIDNGKTTEWKASIKNNVLRLDKVVEKSKTPSVYIILVRAGKDENEQVVN